MSEAASPKKNVKDGNRLYSRGDYKASELKFTEALAQSPESDIVNYNLGTTLYKNGDYERAIDHYQKAFLSEDDKIKQKSYYNLLGNTFYKLGIEQEKENAIPFAVSSLEKSIGQYKRALSIDTKDADTKHNLQFVEGELKRIQEIQRQQQQQKGQGDQSEQSQQQKNQNSGEESEEQQGQQQQEQEGNKQELGEERSEHQQGESGEEEDKNEENIGEKPLNASELTEEEAKMLLKSYQQTEEPQGQLNMQKRQSETRPVAKDW